VQVNATFGLVVHEKKVGTRIRTNWRFWQRVLRPVLEEIGDRSPMYPALLVPNSKLPVKVEMMAGRGGTTTANRTAGTDRADPAATGVEFCVREAGGVAPVGGVGVVGVVWRSSPQAHRANTVITIVSNRARTIPL